MLTYAEKTGASHVKFVSYDGDGPNFCSGELVLIIDGVTHYFSDAKYARTNLETEIHHKAFWTRPCLSEEGEWEIMCTALPKSLLPYAYEIDRVFNDNVENCCCGGCE